MRRYIILQTMFAWLLAHSAQEKKNKKTAI